MCWKTCSATWNGHVLHCRGVFFSLPPMPTLYMCTRGIPTRPPGHPERRRLRVAHRTPKLLLLLPIYYSQPASKLL